MNEYNIKSFVTGCWKDRARVINALSAADLKADPCLAARVREVAKGDGADGMFVVTRCRELLKEAGL